MREIRDYNSVPGSVIKLREWGYTTVGLGISFPRRADLIWFDNGEYRFLGMKVFSTANTFSVGHIVGPDPANAAPDAMQLVPSSGNLYGSGIGVAVWFQYSPQWLWIAVYGVAPVWADYLTAPAKGDAVINSTAQSGRASSVVPATAGPGHVGHWLQSGAAGSTCLAFVHFGP